MGEPVVALNAVAGVHEYVVAPFAVSVALCCPTQIAGGGVTVITGSGFTVTATCVDDVHPLLSVPVTVYVVVALNAVAGVHEYVVAPFAVSVALCCPTQIAGGGVTVITGRGLTVTVT